MPIHARLRSLLLVVIVLLLGAVRPQAQGLSTPLAASESVSPSPRSPEAKASPSSVSLTTWLVSNRPAIESGLALRKAALRMGRALRNAGWTDAAVPPFKNLASVTPPQRPLSYISDDELLELTRRYEELATPAALEALAAARRSLDAVPAEGGELTAEQHDLLEQTLGYSRFVTDAHVPIAQVVARLRLDLFDPDDHGAVTRGIQTVHDALNSSARATSVLAAVEVMRRAYEMHQVQPIVDLASERWFQRGEHLQDAKTLQQALVNDYRNLINIRLIFIPGMVVERDGELHVGVHWARRAVIARASRHWVREDRFARFVFTREAGKLKLLRTEGEPPFALTNRFGVLQLTEGTIDHVRIDLPVKVENGLITAGDPRGPTRRGVATVSGTAQGAGFVFATGQRVLAQPTAFSGDVVFIPTVAGPSIVGLQVASSSTGGLQALASTSLAAVRAVPITGYSTLPLNAATMAVTGRVIAVQTADGKYAKIRIVRANHTAASFTAVFDWVYQPDSSPDVP